MSLKNLRIFIIFLYAVFSFTLFLSAENPDVIILKEEKPDLTRGDSATQALEQEEQPNLAGDSFSFFYQHWKNFEIAYAEGNRAKQDKLLQEMQNWRAYHLIPSLPQLAESLLQMGDSEFAARNKTDALRMYQAAAEFDPSFSTAYYKQARVYLSDGIKSLFPALKSVYRGIMAPRTTSVGRLQWYSKYILLLMSTMIICAFLFAIMLAIKYFRELHHDLHERLSSRYSDTMIDFLVWVIFLIPALLFLGPLWLAPFWLMLFWPYSRLPEKFVGLAFLLVFIVAYPAYQKSTQWMKAYHDAGIAPYITVFTGGASHKSIADFREYFEQNPRDFDAHILLAYLYKTNRQIQPATEILQKYILMKPSDARAYNNLGNIYFMQGEVDSAIRLIQRASQLDSGNAIYRYNLSKLQRAKFNFVDAQRLMEDARTMDPVFVKAQETLPPERLIDAVPTSKLIWEKIEQRNGRPSAAFKNPFTLVAFFLLFVTFTLAVSRHTVASACSKCGKAFCNKCQSSAKKYDYCTQCLHIFVRKDGVSPVSRREKMKEIDRHSRRQSFYVKLSSLLIPGSGNLFEDRTILGASILFLWFFVLLFLFFQKRLTFLTFFDSPEAFPVLAPFCIFILAVLYLVANLSFIKKSKV